MCGGWERWRGVGGEDGILAEGGEAGDALAGGGGGVEGGDRRLGRVVVESWWREEDGPAVDAAEEALDEQSANHRDQKAMELLLTLMTPKLVKRRASTPSSCTSYASIHC